MIKSVFSEVDNSTLLFSATPSVAADCKVDVLTFEASVNKMADQKAKATASAHMTTMRGQMPSMTEHACKAEVAKLYRDFNLSNPNN
jgi:hypothetical protein